MTIGEHDSTFEGRPIEEFSSDAGIQNVEVAIRLAVEYDAWEDGTKVPDLIAQLCEDPKAPQVKALVIGPCGYDGDDPADPIYAKLAEPETAATLSGLKALFVGDITYEEQEISWIVQGDVGPVLAAYPQLEVLRVRGGNGLALNGLESSSLRKLVVETGGLRRELIEQVCNSKLPNLEHLELWLGSENYEADHTVDDLMPLLSGRLFPKLRYLGLRDCEWVDALVPLVIDSPLLAKLHVLDLSLGVLTDAGAAALLMSRALEPLKKLKKLDLHHHYVSPWLIDRLKAAGYKLDASGFQIPEVYEGEIYRNVAVSE